MPKPEAMFRVAPAARLKVPVNATVAEPNPAEPAAARNVEAPPTRLRLPNEIDVAAASRPMKSNAPPSSSMATSAEIRVERAWMPVSFQRRTALRTLIVSPAPMPEKRPWSSRLTTAPMIVAFPVKALLSRKVRLVAPVTRRFRLPLIWPAKSRAVASPTCVRLTAEPLAVFVMTPPEPGNVPRLSKNAACPWPFRSKTPPLETMALAACPVALPVMVGPVLNL